MDRIQESNCRLISLVASNMNHSWRSKLHRYRYTDSHGPLRTTNQSRVLCRNKLPTKEQILRNKLPKYRIVLYEQQIRVVCFAETNCQRMNKYSETNCPNRFALYELIRTAGEDSGGTDVDGWEGNWRLISLIASNMNHKCWNKLHRYKYTPAGGTKKQTAQIQNCALRAANQSRVLCRNKLPMNEQILRNKLPKYRFAIYGQQIRVVCSAETNCQRMNKYSETNCPNTDLRSTGSKSEPCSLQKQTANEWTNTQKQTAQIQICALRAANQSRVLCRINCQRMNKYSETNCPNTKQLQNKNN